jgi:hypothetical protein
MRKPLTLRVSSGVGARRTRPERQHDLGDLERRASDHLPDPGFDIAEASQDDLAGGDPVGDPPVFALDGFEYGIKTLAEVWQIVIVVEGSSVAGVHRRG